MANGDGNNYSYSWCYSWFAGYIDEARLYRRALSGAEIQSIYNAR
jgi:hypothetical protein